MSSGELNKIFAAVLLAGLIAMMSGFIAGKLVHPHVPEQTAFRVEVPDAAPAAGAAPAAPAAPEPIGPLLASADVEAGQRQFRACASCHTVDRGGASRVGPNLWGVVGGPHAHIDGFGYSEALRAMADRPWDFEELNAFLANPRAYAPGNRMNFNGIRSAQDRANLIAWLRLQHDDPPPLPAE